jgi:gag-polypeptide of LTR copia-type
MSITSGTTAILTTVPMLDSTNWYDWSKGMKMFFMGAEADGIASGSPPSDPTELVAWKKLDRKMTAYIYSKVNADYHYLVEDLESGAEAWQKLKAHFQKSTMGNRMQARKELYAVEHDPSRPVDFYIQALTSAKKKLTALGCVVDSELKDILLMNLHTSFHPIRTNILAQSTEPSLDEMKTLLTSSTAADDYKQESPIAALLVNSRGKGSHYGHKHGSSTSCSQVDEHGFKWCDTSNDTGCHRCGHPGHIAARCVHNMPPSIREWVFSNTSSNANTVQEQALNAYTIYNPSDTRLVWSGPLLRMAKTRTFSYFITSMIYIQLLDIYHIYIGYNIYNI